MKKTDALTPEEIERRARILEEQARKLREESINVEMGEPSIKPTRKSVSQTKRIINISYCVFGIIGIIGSFWTKFDMMKFTNFLRIFALLWAPLIISFGAGRAFKNYTTKKYGDDSSDS